MSSGNHTVSYNKQHKKINKKMKEVRKINCNIVKYCMQNQ